MKTIKELSDDAFYNMHNYSQIIIDLVQECELALEIETDEENHKIVERCMCLHYDVDNLLEVIDPNRNCEISALTLMSSLLDSEIKKRT